LKQLFTELLIEVPKLEDKDYECCVIVHPEDIEEVLKFINSAATEYYKESAYVECNRYFNHIKVNGYIRIGTVEVEDWHMVNHAGMQYTTMLIDIESFGKYVEHENDKYPVFEPVGLTKFEDSLPYMVSRLRSNSKYSTRMVIC
jgi:uncharacterized short protein YbdD (DUF466 family)